MSNQPINSKTTIAQSVLSLLILGGLIYLVVKIVGIFASLQKETAAALITAFATITVSVITVVVGKHYERKKTIEQEIRAKKIPVYEDFLQFLFKFMKAAEAETPVTQEETMEFFTRFNEKMVIWGSSDVIRTWSKFRLSAGTRPPAETIYDMEQVLLAIRKDTGHGDGLLKKGDILSLFINDLNKE